MESALVPGNGLIGAHPELLGSKDTPGSESGEWEGMMEVTGCGARREGIEKRRGYHECGECLLF